MPPPTPTGPMTIVERAFSFSGLLVRTFHHAEEAPPAPSTTASEVPSPSWISEQLPKQSRGGQRKKRKTGDADTALAMSIQLDLSPLLTPGVTPSEGSSQYDRERPESPALPDPNSAWPPKSEYLHLLTPEELRAVQLRNRRGKAWIPGDLAIKKELDRLGRRESWMEVMNGIQERRVGVGGPIQDMQETSCTTDVGAFVVEGPLDIPVWGRGDMTPTTEDCNPFSRIDYSTTETSIESPSRSMTRTVGIGAMATGRESEYPSPPRPPMLPSPVAVSTKDGQRGLYLPPLPTHVTDNDLITPPSSSLLVKLPLPGQLRNHSQEINSPTQPIKPLTISPNPPPESHSRGRPLKNPRHTDAPSPPQLTVMPITTPPTPSQSPLLSKPKHASTHTPDLKTAPLPMQSIPVFLEHLTSTISTAQSGFIPRPVNVSYTLPLPASSEYKGFAVDLVARISQIDAFQWTIAHSQWTASKSNFTAGARWVCNLSEEGVRDRSAKGGPGVGKALDIITNKRPRFPCGGSIAIRFSTKQGITVIRYSHHALHAPPKDLSEQAQIKRIEEHQTLIASNVWGPSSGPPLPLPAVGQDAQADVGGLGWR